MSDKFQNKYRIPSARAIWWDYSDEGAYFVTICTAGREYYFGDITIDQMQLSEIGEIAHRCWLQIPNHFPFVKLDAFVVMPNHVHGILVIDKKYGGGGRDVACNVSTENALTCNVNTNEKMAAISPKQGSLASIIRSYKSAVTKNARPIHAEFAWQTRFWDHIIRDNESYYKIRNYIEENPVRWGMDQLNNDPDITT